MDSIDINSLSKEKYEQFVTFLNVVKEGAFVRQEFDNKRTAIDLALKQEYKDTTTTTTGVNDRLADLKDRAILNGDSTLDLGDDDGDEFSELYWPILLSLYRTWLTALKNLNFPTNGDWVEINRKNSRFFSENNIKKFLPQANICWENILKTENTRYDFKNKYCVNIGEVVAYGNTCLAHAYNTDSDYVDLVTPGIRNAGIFPLTDKWEESNCVYFYDVNYSDLIDRADLNQDYIALFAPSNDQMQSRTLASLGSNNYNQALENRVPYGKIRLYDFFLPSVFLDSKDDDDELLVYKNVYVTAAIAPILRNGKESPEEVVNQIYILKATEKVDAIAHGIRFGSFGVNLRGVFYHQGPLQPFLHHQAIGNQLISSTARITAMITDPPLTSISEGPMVDIEQTPSERLEPGRVYEGRRISAIIPSEYYQVVNQFQSFIGYLEKAVEQGSGLGKNQMGVINSGKRSATEIKEASSGAQMNVVEAAGLFDDQILRPSVTIRLLQTQRQLQQQIEKEAESLVQVEAIDFNQIIEISLSENKLFRRLLEFSGVEDAYEDFYKTTQLEILEDRAIKSELTDMKKAIESQLEFADSAIDPFNPPPGEIDSVTGEMLPHDPLMLKQAEEQYYASEEQARSQALQQINALSIELERKQLQLKHVEEPPEPSFELYYRMFVENIQSSDITVTGSMSSVSKDLARQYLTQFIELFSVLSPDARTRINEDSLVEMLAKFNNISRDKIFKSPEDLMKAQQQMQAQQQQMQMQQ